MIYCEDLVKGDDGFLVFWLMLWIPVLCMLFWYTSGCLELYFFIRIPNNMVY